MGILVVLLVAAWGLVLGPALLRNTQDPSPLDTEKMFRRALRALGGSRRSSDDVVGGRNVLVPRKAEYPVGRTGFGAYARPTAAERRKRNLTNLAIFIIVTFLLGLIPALRFLLVLNLIADVLLIAYLGAAMYFAAFAKRPEPMSGIRTFEREITPPEAAGGGF